MKKYNLINVITGWVVFAIAAVVYLLTIEPTISFWDCGEFITTSYRMEVGHPPGAPFFMLLGRFFTLFAGAENVGRMMNTLSAIASALTIMFLFWSITHLAKRMVHKAGEISLGQTIAIMASGLVGALAYSFSDTFWFSAVEAEVYATSSLLTAIVFWAILKWENIADQPRSNRWLVLIAYIIGLSVGVHLLNLLAIPAIALVYYFRKYKPSLKGIIIAILVSFALVAGIMYVIIPGIVVVASWLELLFVNSFGLPIHSGAIFYLVVLTAALIFGIYFTQKRKKVFWNTVIVMLTVIVLGYSSYGLIIIRASAQPPMNQNDPSTVFNLLSYLNRDQYGQRPLFYGKYFNSPFDTDVRYEQTGPVYTYINGKYKVTDYKLKPNYDDKFETVFPRMWSDVEQQHIADYKQWTNIKGRKIRHRNERGETVTIVKPTFSENLKFFFRYQVGYMYMRYFMWNFAGRQNDIQGHGGILHGNWLSGINFIDNWRLGEQNNLPAKFTNNKARNTYYLLPLLLGLLGIFTQYNKGKKGKQGLWVVSLLFFMTGLAIVVYLNQYPHQPRERDYAYAGSFYAFTIWIGLGVLGLFDLLKKIAPSTIAASAAGGIALMLVPGIMAVENWDDHDRSGRYTARDFGANYLETVKPNGIIFTNGDNDTFPLWYNQDVEGVRTDVRVCNLSYFQADWYINQMGIRAYESDPLPFSMDESKYRQGTRDAVYLLDDPRIKRDYIEINKAIDFIASDNPSTKLQQAEGAAYLPKKVLKIVVDKEAVIKNKVVEPHQYDQIADTITIDLSNRDYLPKDEMMLLDMIAHNNWERPIYWAITVGRSKYLNLQDYFQVEGFAYRFVPIKNNEADERVFVGTIATDIMYENVMNRFKWGNMNDSSVYIDENNARMMSNIRNTFNRLAEALIKEGKKDSAIKVIDRAFELTPESVIPFEFFALQLANSYSLAGSPEKGNAILEKSASTLDDELNYYLSLDPKFILSPDVADEVQRNMFYLQRLEGYARKNGNEELSKKVVEIMELTYNKFAALQ